MTPEEIARHEVTLKILKDLAETAEDAANIAEACRTMLEHQAAGLDLGHKLDCRLTLDLLHVDFLCEAIVPELDRMAARRETK